MVAFLPSAWLKDTLRDASPQHHFSRICVSAVELKLNAVVFSLRSPSACCFVADCVRGETRDRGQTECDNSPLPGWQ